VFPGELQAKRLDGLNDNHLELVRNLTHKRSNLKGWEGKTLDLLQQSHFLHNAFTLQMIAQQNHSNFSSKNFFHAKNDDLPERWSAADDFKTIMLQ
jgi:hypothetical protein